MQNQVNQQPKISNRNKKYEKNEKSKQQYFFQQTMRTSYKLEGVYIPCTHQIEYKIRQSRSHITNTGPNSIPSTNSQTIYTSLARFILILEKINATHIYIPSLGLGQRETSITWRPMRFYPGLRERIDNISIYSLHKNFIRIKTFFEKYIKYWYYKKLRFQTKFLK